jgi:hypothetical protein
VFDRLSNERRLGVRREGNFLEVADARNERRQLVADNV